MTCYYIENCIDSGISWKFPQVNSKDGIDFAMLFTLRESRRTSDSALLRVRSKKLRLHPQTPWLWSPPAFATLGLTRNFFRLRRGAVRPKAALSWWSCWSCLPCEIFYTLISPGSNHFWVILHIPHYEVLRIDSSKNFIIISIDLLNNFCYKYSKKHK